MVVVEKGGAEFYIDNNLSRQLDGVIKRVKKKDEDYFFAIDGKEGGGKSVFAMQVAKYLDPTFSLARVCFTPKEFSDAVIGAKKGEAVVFDEAFRGLSSRGALTEVNKLLVSLMMECRQKNLFVFVVMPSFFLLDKYAALWRCRGLFHVYRKDGRRGFWVLYNERKKKLLYLKGRTTYSYSFPRSHMRGRFLNQYVVDEKEYRANKWEALQNTNRNTRAENYLDHRNTLFWLLNRELGISTTKISDLCSGLGWKIEQNSISECVVRKHEQLVKAGVLQE